GCGGGGCGGGGCGDGGGCGGGGCGDEGGCGGGGCGDGCGCGCGGGGKVQSDDHGWFEFGDLEPGQYRLTASAEGVGTVTEIVVIEAEQAHNRDLILSPELGVSSDVSISPEQLELVTAYPNPFNAQTNISVNLNKADLINLTIYDMNGCSVQTLFQGQLEAGQYEFSLNGANLSVGSYILRSQIGAHTQNNLLLYIK
ncbi:MAG: T9SS type A sorting domain-containing protein, partial [Calditrichota bacterium]